MHPQIVRDTPGSCPICGMALEPRTAGADDGPDPELRDMTRRFWIGLLLTLPLLVFVMGDMLPGEPLRHLIPGRISAWLQLILATPVVLWAGWPFFVRGWASVVNRSLNMFTLIALGTGTAYVYSVVGAAGPGLFPTSFRTHGGEIGLYFEAAAVITVLVLLGQVLELRARSQTSGAIKALLNLAPPTARRVRADGLEEDVPLETVKVGDRLRVRPGERIPHVESSRDGEPAVGVIDRLRFQHRDEYAQEAIDDPAQRPSVTVAPSAELLVVGPTVGIVADSGPSPVVYGVAQPVVTGIAHLDAAVLTALLGHGGDARVGAQGVVVSLRQELRGLGEHRGGDDSPDSRQGPEDRHVTMPLTLP